MSRQHFYDIKKAYDEQGIEGLREKTRRKPCLKNRVVPEIEAVVIQMAYEYPAYGQTRASNELRKQGVIVSSGGVRGIWLWHGLEQFRKRLALLEEKEAKGGIVYICDIYTRYCIIVLLGLNTFLRLDFRRDKLTDGSQ